MEVLRGRRGPVAPCARATSSSGSTWRPPAGALDAAGALLGLHPLALEDSREFFSGRSSTAIRGPAVRLLAGGTPTTGAREPVEVHLHISGGLLFTVRHAQPAPTRRAARRAGGGHEAEDYVLYRVLDAPTDALYPVIDHLEARIDAHRVRGAPRSSPAAARPHPPAQAGGPAAATAALLCPARPVSAGERGDPLPARASTLSKREYFRDVGDHLVQLTGELQRQPRRPQHADLDVLQRERHAA